MGCSRGSKIAEKRPQLAETDRSYSNQSLLRCRGWIGMDSSGGFAVYGSCKSASKLGPCGTLAGRPVPDGLRISVLPMPPSFDVHAGRPNNFLVAGDGVSRAIDVDRPSLPNLDRAWLDANSDCRSRSPDACCRHLAGSRLENWFLLPKNGCPLARPFTMGASWIRHYHRPSSPFFAHSHPWNVGGDGVAVDIDLGDNGALDRMRRVVPTFTFMDSSACRIDP